jgi:hypothetical protein
VIVPPEVFAALRIALLASVVTFWAAWFWLGHRLPLPAEQRTPHRLRHMILGGGFLGKLNAYRGKAQNKNDRLGLSLVLLCKGSIVAWGVLFLAFVLATATSGP